MSRNAALALAKATTALQKLSAREVQALPLLDCAIMLSALPDSAPLTGVRKRLASRLQAQLQPQWIEHGDACEVFCALVALWKYDSAFVSGEHLACAIKRLIVSEVSVGGPYYSGGTIALTANIPIAIFMRLAAKPLPNVDALLAEVVAAKRFDDTEFTPFGLLYLFAHAGHRPALAAYVTEHWQQKQWQTPGRTAIALTIAQASAKTAQITQALEFLCQSQHKNGLWDGEPFLKLAPAREDSKFATTALIIEALAQYQQTPPQTTPLGNMRQHHLEVVRAVKQMFTSCREPLRSSALKMVDQVSQVDKNFEITGLSHIFASALKTPSPLTDEQHNLLGQASLYGWIAYTIYDDFLDAEGQPADLPIANIAMRTSVECFRQALPDQHDFQAYAVQAFTNMDEANAWEVQHCRLAIDGETITIGRLPQYGNGDILAARSFAHSLAPTADIAKDFLYTPRAKKIETAFRHYLIARQIDDDLLDWQQDMQKGHASYVVTAILRDMRCKSGAYNLPALLQKMHTRFGQSTVQEMSQRILWHITKSRQAFAASQLLRDANNIYLSLDKLEQSVVHTLDAHQKAESFLHQYQKDTPNKSKK